MATVVPHLASPAPSDDLRHTLASAHSVLGQAPPPSLREILSAYRAKGDGDRDMLLAMLNAKTAEDQRISSVASLQRTILNLYQYTSEVVSSPLPREPARGYPFPVYPTYPDPVSRKLQHGFRGRSPRRAQAPYLPPMPGNPHKRHRSSRSPHYEPLHPTEQFPPSPYSSSERSQSAEYSPRSRTSGITIGSLLSDSTGPRRDSSGDATRPDRD